MRVVLTGATGFVGKALSRALVSDGHDLTALVRTKSTDFPKSISQIVIGELASLTSPPRHHESNYSQIDSLSDTKASSYEKSQNNYPASEPNLLHPENGVLETTTNTKIQKTLQQTDVVIHTAARVHVMNDKSTNPLEEFRRINTAATIALARQAAEAGVKRFIFLSTVKVHGETTDGRAPFSERDDCKPTDPYAISKWEAEQALVALSQTTDMDVVIIRPPLIYGRGVKGNFASMMHWVGKGVPLPLGKAKNKRSLLALDNLVSYILHCLDKPEAANQVYLLSDGEDVSTAELVKIIARSQNKKARLLPIPVGLMSIMAALIGKKAAVQRIFGSLQVDSSKAAYQLGWRSVVTMKKQIENMNKYTEK